MDTATARPTVFVSYSHQDEAWKDRLVKQLRVLELEGELEVWDDRRIDAGDDWLPEIEAAMARARVAVLLISADFLGSTFILRREVPEILRRRGSEGLRVIPVIVRPCPWQAVPWLSKIQCLPKDGRPLSAGNEHQIETDLSALALEIRGLLVSFPPRSLQGSLVRGSQGFEPLASAAPLHNLPYSALNDLFTGRQEELDALSTGGTAAITQSAAISGLGGIGKTRLAVEYAWRSGNRYTAAWFVRADSPESLRRNLAGLAGPELLNLPEWKVNDEAETVAAVKRWLREHRGWLMILDNVDTDEAVDAVLEVLPSLYVGHVLITSRLTSWPANVRKQSLDKLSHEEAVAFLLHRTKHEREPAADDPERAADLAERVDGLPLALEQAAAYIIRHRLRLSEYLRAWEQEHDKLLQWYDSRVMQYPASVAVTWKQTFNRLSPTPAALLRLMAFLAPDPIPFEMLEQGVERVKRAAELFCEEVGTAVDGKTIREATADLADYSLITRQGGGMVVVHRMVQAALRSQIPEEQRRDWVEGALRIVDEAAVGDPEDVRTWPVWDRLRPHVAEVAARADEAGIVEPASRLMNDLGLLLWAKGLYTEAEPLMRRALALREISLGPEHEYVATTLNNLALVLKATNRLEEAEPLLRRALAIDEAYFGKEHPEIAMTLNNLAWLLQARERMEEAEPLLRRALTVTESSFGNGHPNIALFLNNLTGLLQATTRFGEAEPLMRRALDIAEASFGNEHPSVARGLNHLAGLLRDTNRLEEAEPLARRAVEIYEHSLGQEHPRTQAARENLESLLAKISATAPGGDDDLTAPEAP
jgi:tetratricopeptide (TPR) repeat protein